MRITKEMLQYLIFSINEKTNGNLELNYDVRFGYNMPCTCYTNPIVSDLCINMGMTAREMYTYLQGIWNTIKYVEHKKENEV